MTDVDIMTQNGHRVADDQPAERAKRLMAALLEDGDRVASNLPAVRRLAYLVQAHARVTWLASLLDWRLECEQCAGEPIGTLRLLKVCEHLDAAVGAVEPKA